MTGGEYEQYSKFLSRVQAEVKQLRDVLGNVKARAKERTWLKHQSTGDLDDAKLIDGMVGERLIFKRRGEVAPLPGGPNTKPKRIQFVMDCSGSMYRFNGQDGRLDRMLEAAAMLMEGLEGLEGRFDYSTYFTSSTENYGYGTSCLSGSTQECSHLMQHADTLLYLSPPCLSPPCHPIRVSLL